MLYRQRSTFFYEMRIKLSEKNLPISKKSFRTRPHAKNKVRRCFENSLGGCRQPQSSGKRKEERFR